MVNDATPEVVLKAITDNDESTRCFPGNLIPEPEVGDQVKFSRSFSLKVKS
jgi:carbon monoxide dehydrogenase subunit G